MQRCAERGERLLADGENARGAHMFERMHGHTYRRTDTRTHVANYMAMGESWEEAVKVLGQPGATIAF